MKTEPSHVIKIYEIAKAINRSHDIIISFLQQRGYKEINLFSHVTDEMMNDVRTHFNKDIERASLHSRKIEMLLGKRAKKTKRFSEIIERLNIITEPISPNKKNIKKSNSHFKLEFVKYDYWRTWFLEECESNHLFGVTDYQKDYICKNYNLKTKIFLDDAPLHYQKQLHRICGPYDVFNADKIPNNSIILQKLKSDLVIYQQRSPNVSGPYKNNKIVSKLIHLKNGFVKLTFPHMASPFHYFPYRFAIKKNIEHTEQFIECPGSNCRICKKIKYQSD